MRATGAVAVVAVQAQWVPMRFQHVLAMAELGELLLLQEPVSSTQEAAEAEAVRTATPQLQLATAEQTVAVQVRRQIT